VGPALVRIDDRLLHGQVTQGWAATLGSKLIVIADDEVAGDEWRSQIYTEAAPPEARVEVLEVKEAARRFVEFVDDELAAIVLVKDAFDAVELAERGADVRSVNVGGMHYVEGKRELLPYLFVDDRDESALRRLIELGLKVEAQDVPGGKRHSVATLLEKTG
jgi:mannose/fructose/N-acetylgalactosamine-specific phosphotransferase system component IIB